MDITQAIREFLVPGQKSTNANLDRYPKEYLGLEVDLSFGLGMPSKVRWMGFFGDGHTVQNGYYPTFLFYEKENKLMLVYGVSVTEKLNIEDVWDENIRTTKKQIKVYKLEHSKKNDYSKSYVHHYYEPKKVNGEFIFYRDNKVISDEQFLSELNEIISYYKKCLDSDKRPFWFVGAVIDNKDLTNEFIEGGYWEHGFDEKYHDYVHSMKEGDQIAIKAAYTRKKGLPFETYSNITSVMSIKATGVIEENLGDGKKILVNWNKVEPIREWYFYTYRPTVWKVLPGAWMNDAIIDFTFNNQPQDIDRFRNDPFWLDRYATDPTKLKRFQWTRFFQAIADELIKYKNNRQALIVLLQSISSKIDALKYLSSDTFSDGSRGFVKDIDPFTFFGVFNRGIKDSTRIKIAIEIAESFGVNEPVPERFEGVPVLNNMSSWYFPWNKELPDDHIDKLWEVFESALQLADSEDEDLIEKFSKDFDTATSLYGVSWNLSCGLYWIRPWHFLNLDGLNRKFITEKLHLKIGLSGPKKICNSNEYLLLTNTLRERFVEPDFSVHSFPELSFNAWTNSGSGSSHLESDEPEEITSTDESKNIDIKEYEPYQLENIIDEGAFVELEKLEKIMRRLKEKKNLILQGPPGTGKTWLAKRIGKALIGKDVDVPQIRSVQFHPNLSYEDFVRGWRPGSDEKLSLKEGTFMEMVSEAKNNPEEKYVLIIEEINRGNPAQIFGELLTLIESSKRNKKDSIQLCYPDSDGKYVEVFVPDNLYILGTMNLADRSLALVDMAFRRRFAFFDLEPTLNSAWKKYVVNEMNMDRSIAENIQLSIGNLNNEISNDYRLGKQFQIGHSFFTPTESIKNKDSKSWFNEVVESEIKPLLEEHWFDAPEEVEKSIKKLITD